MHTLSGMFRRGREKHEQSIQEDAGSVEYFQPETGQTIEGERALQTGTEGSHNDSENTASHLAQAVKRRSIDLANRMTAGVRNRRASWGPGQPHDLSRLGEMATAEGSASQSQHSQLSRQGSGRGSGSSLVGSSSFKWLKGSRERKDSAHSKEAASAASPARDQGAGQAVLLDADGLANLLDMRGGSVCEIGDLRIYKPQQLLLTPSSGHESRASSNKATSMKSAVGPSGPVSHPPLLQPSAVVPLDLPAPWAHPAASVGALPSSLGLGPNPTPFQPSLAPVPAPSMTTEAAPQPAAYGGGIRSSTQQAPAVAGAAAGSGAAACPGSLDASQRASGDRCSLGSASTSSSRDVLMHEQEAARAVEQQQQCSVAGRVAPAVPTTSMTAGAFRAAPSALPTSPPGVQCAVPAAPGGASASRIPLHPAAAATPGGPPATPALLVPSPQAAVAAGHASPTSAPSPMSALPQDTPPAAPAPGPATAAADAAPSASGAASSSKAGGIGISSKPSRIPRDPKQLAKLAVLQQELQALKELKAKRDMERRQATEAEAAATDAHAAAGQGQWVQGSMADAAGVETAAAAAPLPPEDHAAAACTDAASHTGSSNTRSRVSLAAALQQAPEAPSPQTQHRSSFSSSVTPVTLADLLDLTAMQNVAGQVPASVTMVARSASGSGPGKSQRESTPHSSHPNSPLRPCQGSGSLQLLVLQSGSFSRKGSSLGSRAEEAVPGGDSLLEAALGQLAKAESRGGSFSGTAGIRVGPPSPRVSGAPSLSVLPNAPAAAAVGPAGPPSVAARSVAEPAPAIPVLLPTAIGVGAAAMPAAAPMSTATPGVLPQPLQAALPRQHADPWQQWQQQHEQLQQQLQMLQVAAAAAAAGAGSDVDPASASQIQLLQQIQKQQMQQMQQQQQLLAAASIGVMTPPVGNATGSMSQCVAPPTAGLADPASLLPAASTAVPASNPTGQSPAPTTAAPTACLPQQAVDSAGQVEQEQQKQAASSQPPQLQQDDKPGVITHKNSDLGYTEWLRRCEQQEEQQQVEGAAAAEPASPVASGPDVGYNEWLEQQKQQEEAAGHMHGHSGGDGQDDDRGSAESLFYELTKTGKPHKEHQGQHAKQAKAPSVISKLLGSKKAGSSSKAAGAGGSPGGSKAKGQQQQQQQQSMQAPELATLSTQELRAMAQGNKASYGWRGSLEQRAAAGAAGTAGQDAGGVETSHVQLAEAKSFGRDSDSSSEEEQQPNSAENPHKPSVRTSFVMLRAGKPGSPPSASPAGSFTAGIRVGSLPPGARATPAASPVGPGFIRQGEPPPAAAGEKANGTGAGRRSLLSQIGRNLSLSIPKTGAAAMRAQVAAAASASACPVELKNAGSAGPRGKLWASRQVGFGGATTFGEQEEDGEEKEKEEEETHTTSSNTNDFMTSHMASYARFTGATPVTSLPGRLLAGAAASFTAMARPGGKKGAGASKGPVGRVGGSDHQGEAEDNKESWIKRFASISATTTLGRQRVQQQHSALVSHTQGQGQGQGVHTSSSTILGSSATVSGHMAASAPLASPSLAAEASPPGPGPAPRPSAGAATLSSSHIASIPSSSKKKGGLVGAMDAMRASLSFTAPPSTRSPAATEATVGGSFSLGPSRFPGSAQSASSVTGFGYEASLASRRSGLVSRVQRGSLDVRFGGLGTGRAQRGAASRFLNTNARRSLDMAADRFTRDDDEEEFIAAQSPEPRYSDGQLYCPPPPRPSANSPPRLHGSNARGSPPLHVHHSGFSAVSAFTSGGSSTTPQYQGQSLLRSQPPHAVGAAAASEEAVGAADGVNNDEATASDLLRTMDMLRATVNDPPPSHASPLPSPQPSPSPAKSASASMPQPSPQAALASSLYGAPHGRPPPAQYDPRVSEPGTESERSTVNSNLPLFTGSKLPTPILDSLDEHRPGSLVMATFGSVTPEMHPRSRSAGQVNLGGPEQPRLPSHLEIAADGTEVRYEHNTLYLSAPEGTNALTSDLDIQNLVQKLKMASSSPVGPRISNGNNSNSSWPESPRESPNGLFHRRVGSGSNPGSASGQSGVQEGKPGSDMSWAPASEGAPLLPGSLGRSGPTGSLGGSRPGSTHGGKSLMRESTGLGKAFTLVSKPFRSNPGTCEFQMEVAEIEIEEDVDLSMLASVQSVPIRSNSRDILGDLAAAITGSGTAGSRQAVRRSRTELDSTSAARQQPVPLPLPLLHPGTSSTTNQPKHIVPDHVDHAAPAAPAAAEPPSTADSLFTTTDGIGTGAGSGHQPSLPNPAGHPATDVVAHHLASALLARDFSQDLTKDLSRTWSSDMSQDTSSAHLQMLAPNASMPMPIHPLPSPPSPPPLSLGEQAAFQFPLLPAGSAGPQPPAPPAPGAEQLATAGPAPPTSMGMGLMMAPTLPLPLPIPMPPPPGGEDPSGSAALQLPPLALPLPALIADPTTVATSDGPTPSTDPQVQLQMLQLQLLQLQQRQQQIQQLQAAQQQLQMMTAIEQGALGAGGLMTPAFSMPLAPAAAGAAVAAPAPAMHAPLDTARLQQPAQPLLPMPPSLMPTVDVGPPAGAATATPAAPAAAAAAACQEAGAAATAGSAASTPVPVPAAAAAADVVVPATAMAEQEQQPEQEPSTPRAADSTTQPGAPPSGAARSVSTPGAPPPSPEIVEPSSPLPSQPDPSTPTPAPAPGGSAGASGPGLVDPAASFRRTRPLSSAPAATALGKPVGTSVSSAVALLVAKLGSLPKELRLQIAQQLSGDDLGLMTNALGSPLRSPAAPSEATATATTLSIDATATSTTTTAAIISTSTVAVSPEPACKTTTATSVEPMPAAEATPAAAAPVGAATAATAADARDNVSPADVAGFVPAASTTPEDHQPPHVTDDVASSHTQASAPDSSGAGPDDAPGLSHPSPATKPSGPVAAPVVAAAAQQGPAATEAPGASAGPREPSPRHAPPPAPAAAGPDQPSQAADPNTVATAAVGGTVEAEQAPPAASAAAEAGSAEPEQTPPHDAPPPATASAGPSLPDPTAEASTAADAAVTAEQAPPAATAAGEADAEPEEAKLPPPHALRIPSASSTPFGATALQAAPDTSQSPQSLAALAAHEEEVAGWFMPVAPPPPAGNACADGEHGWAEAEAAWMQLQLCKQKAARERQRQLLERLRQRRLQGSPQLPDPTSPAQPVLPRGQSPAGFAGVVESQASPSTPPAVPLPSGHQPSQESQLSMEASPTLSPEEVAVWFSAPVPAAHAEHKPAAAGPLTALPAAASAPAAVAVADPAAALGKDVAAWFLPVTPPSPSELAVVAAHAEGDACVSLEPASHTAAIPAAAPGKQQEPMDEKHEDEDDEDDPSSCECGSALAAKLLAAAKHRRSPSPPPSLRLPADTKPAETPAVPPSLATEQQHSTASDAAYTPGATDPGANIIASAPAAMPASPSLAMMESLPQLRVRASMERMAAPGAQQQAAAAGLTPVPGSSDGAYAYVLDTPTPDYTRLDDPFATTEAPSWVGAPGTLPAPSWDATAAGAAASEASQLLGGMLAASAAGAASSSGGGSMGHVYIPPSATPYLLSDGQHVLLPAVVTVDARALSPLRGTGGTGAISPLRGSMVSPLRGANMAATTVGSVTPPGAVSPPRHSGWGGPDPASMFAAPPGYDPLARFRSPSPPPGAGGRPMAAASMGGAGVAQQPPYAPHWVGAPAPWGAMDSWGRPGFGVDGTHDGHATGSRMQSGGGSSVSRLSGGGSEASRQQGKRLLLASHPIALDLQDIRE